MLNARIFQSEQIGIATTLISVSVLITSLSQMGFNTATVSYLPKEKDKQAFIDTAFFMIISSSVVFSVIFLLLLPQLSPPLMFLRGSAFLLILFVFFSTISAVNAITDSFFIAFRDTKFILIIDVVVAITKLVMPLVFVSFAAIGIFYSYLVAVVVGMFLSVFIISHVYHIKFKPIIKISVIKRVWKFSSSSYIASVVGMLSAIVTPILILNNLGPQISAYYYMPSMIISLLMTIPRSISSSMMAEGVSQNGGLLSLATKSIRSAYMLLIPAILAVCILGKYILLAFGKQYSSEGINYLIISSLSLLIIAPNYVLGTILNIKKASSLIIMIGVSSSVLSILFLLTFVKHGLIGVGIANLLGQTCLLILYCIGLYLTNDSFKQQFHSFSFRR